MKPRVVALTALLLAAASNGYAQVDRPAISAEGIGGYASFIDEDPVEHTVLGGAFRYQFSPLLSAGPEVVYMIGPGYDRDLFLTGNIWFDFLESSPGHLRRATPYLVAGAGVMRHANRFFIDVNRSTDFTAYEWAFTGGIGVRISLDDRWYVAPEARLGSELHTRFSVGVGYRFVK